MYLSKITYYKFIPRESFNFVDFLLLLDVDIGSTIKKTGVLAFKKNLFISRRYFKNQKCIKCFL